MVVSILVVLVALLVPVVRGAIERARALTCQTHLRHWHNALRDYAGANRGAIPRRGQGVQPLGRVDRPEDWFNALPPFMQQTPYVDMVARGELPAANSATPFGCPSAKPTDSEHFLPVAMNMYLSPWIRPAPHYLDEIVNLTQVVFMADAPGPYSSTVPSVQKYCVAARHCGRANLVFLDGHIAAYTREYLGCGTGDPGRPDIHWQTETGGINQQPVE